MDYNVAEKRFVRKVYSSSTHEYVHKKFKIILLNEKRLKTFVSAFKMYESQDTYNTWKIIVFRLSHLFHC